MNALLSKCLMLSLFDIHLGVVHWASGCGLFLMLFLCCPSLWLKLLLFVKLDWGSECDQIHTVCCLSTCAMMKMRRKRVPLGWRVRWVLPAAHCCSDLLSTKSMIPVNTLIIARYPSLGSPASRLQSRHDWLSERTAVSNRERQRDKREGIWGEMERPHYALCLIKCYYPAQQEVPEK